MPKQGFDLAKFATVVEHTQLTYKGCTINLGYYPSRLDDEFAQIFSDPDSVPADVYAKLCDIIAEWDITENDEAVPVTPENMEAIPMPVKSLMIQTIGDHATPPKMKGR